MEIKGIDRLVIGVKDMDKSLEFFKKVFGVEFKELKGPLFEQGGVRMCMSLDKHLELISVIPPVKDINPPDTLTLAKWLDERGDAVLFAVALKVDDAKAAAAEAQAKGVRFRVMIEDKQNDILSIKNLKEAFFNEEDMFGLKIFLSQWEPMP